jgi:NADPH:quinone reductase-like Zn-dependent oxidoreductase
MTLRTVLRRTAATIAAGVVLTVSGLSIAYWMSDNDCAERRAAVPQHPMQAVVYCDYGDPGVLLIEDLETPVPGPGQVLVRVRAASVNPLESHYMRGEPYLMRLDGGLRKPSEIRLGVDFAGTVAAVGTGVDAFKTGDEVFGGRTGALAGYVVVSARSIVAKPATVSFVQAGAVAVAGVTALQAVRDTGGVHAGQEVLINGASGGVGTFAVQVAKALGATVTGVSSTRNVELVRSLGADRTIDYTREDYTRGPARFDVIVDMVGNHSVPANRRALRPGGTYVMVGGPSGRWVAPLDRVVHMLVLSPFIDETMSMMLSRLNQADLTVLRDYMQAGRVVPVIDREFPLAQVADAMRYLETGRARGKVVITIGGDG